MRVLVLSQYFAPEIGAPQVRLTALTRVLGTLGHDVEVVTAVPNHPEGVIQQEYRRRFLVTENVGQVQIHRVWMYAASGSGLKRMLSYLSFAVTCVAGLRKAQRPDVIFVESPPPFTMIPAVGFARVWGVPVVLNVADLWPDSATKLGLLNESGFLARLLFRYEKWIYKRAWRLCSVTDGVRKILTTEKSIAASKIVDLPNGVDTEMFQPMEGDRQMLSDYGLIPGNQVLLYAGTVGYAHGLETAIRAMAELSESHPRAHLLVVGAGSQWEDCKAEVRRLGLRNVTMHGAVTPETVADLLAVTDVAISTLRDSPLFEGTRPSKMFPAMASGVPIAYSGAGEGARIVAEAECGLVTAPESEAELAQAFASLLDDESMRAEMGQRGRELALSAFSWESIAAEWLNQMGNPSGIVESSEQS